MHKRFQYILFALILVIVYELYLIVLYKYRDFQINSYIVYLEEENAKTDRIIAEKKDDLAYARTNAFIDRIAKSSQNRKNPGEDAVFMVTKEEADEYQQKMDTNKQIIGEIPSKRSKTYGMTNPQKWIYYAFRVDLRD